MSNFHYDIEIDGTSGIARVLCHDCGGVIVFGLDYEGADPSVGILEAGFTAGHIDGDDAETCTCGEADELAIAHLEDVVGEVATRVLITERGA